MKYLKELKELKLPKDKFAVFGSGPLAIRGLRENEDIDIILKKDIYNDLKSKYPSNEKGGLQIGQIEVYDRWQFGEDVNQLIDSADIIEGIRFVKLEHVLEWKKKRMKEKDIKDIKLIEKYLNSQKQKG